VLRKLRGLPELPLPGPEGSKEAAASPGVPERVQGNA